MTTLEHKLLKFPIGEFNMPDEVDGQLLNEWIETIENFPEKLSETLDGLSIMEFYWRYRLDGWMIKQIIHHCADSHMNSFIRFKLALTEDKPTIKPYFEDRWAELEDGKLDNVAASLQLLEGLHARWSSLLRNLTEEDLTRTFVHPEHGKVISIKENIGTYAWHCRHHLAHIKQALEAAGKYN